MRPRFAPDDIEQGEEGHPRRDQDGRGHARRSRPRAVHAALLGRPSARPADPRVARRRWSRSPPQILRDYFRATYVAPNLIVVGGRQRRARAGPRADRARLRRAALGPRRRSRTRRPRVMPQVVVRAEGPRTEPHLPRHQQLSAEPRGPLRQLHHEHRARRLDELAAVPERPREARPGLRGVQRPERLPRRRATSRSTPAAPNEAVAGSRRPVRRGAARDEADAGARRRAAARQGSSQGQPDAEPREHRRAGCRTSRGRRSTSSGTSGSTRRWPASSG